MYFYRQEDQKYFVPNSGARERNGRKILNNILNFLNPQITFPSIGCRGDSECFRLNLNFGARPDSWSCTG